MFNKSVLNLAKIIGASVLANLGIYVTQDPLTFGSLMRSPKTTIVDPSTETGSSGLVDVLRNYNRADTVLVDARKKQYFDYGSIPNAMSAFSLGTEDLSRLKTARLVIVYGEDSSSLEARNLTASFIEQGYRNITIYNGGWAEWRSCRLPIKMSERMIEDENGKSLK